MYISEDEYFVDYKATPAWQATNIKLGDTSDRREHHLEIPTTPVSWRHEKREILDFPILNDPGAVASTQWKFVCTYLCDKG